MKQTKIKEFFSFSWHNTLITVLILLYASGLCMLLRSKDSGDNYAYMVFLLAVFLISRYTDGVFFGILSALISVLVTNFFFTYPYSAFHFGMQGYPLTVVSMLVVAVVMGMSNAQLRKEEKERLFIEKERTRANLLRAISHDLRTPLTSIMGVSTALLENGEAFSPQDRHKLLSEVREDSQWLIRMVENLLTVTRMDPATNNVALHKEPEAAEEIIADTLQKFHKHFPDVPVQVQMPDELLMIPMDALLIGQVLVNLLENAVYHGEKADRITISVERDGKNAVFEVADNGVGIPASRLASLFHQHISSDANPENRRRNMGIGLTVCSTIVQAHNGQLTARNNEEGGATFRFTLPMEVQA